MVTRQCCLFNKPSRSHLDADLVSVAVGASSLAARADNDVHEALDVLQAALAAACAGLREWSRLDPNNDSFSLTKNTQTRVGPSALTGLLLLLLLGSDLGGLALDLTGAGKRTVHLTCTHT